MPEVTFPQQFQSLITLWMVYISFEAKDRLAYVTLGLITGWDIEHDIGAILHKDRVVAVDDHDSLWDSVERDTVFVFAGQVMKGVESRHFQDNAFRI